MNYLVNFQPVQLDFSGQFSSGVNTLLQNTENSTMDEMPELPDYFIESARNAFFRIYRFLEYHGLWNELCYFVVEMTSMTCHSYLKIAKENKLPACEIEEMRIVARRSLAGCLYIPQGRIHLAAINSDGLDADIVAVCQPFASDYLPAA